MKLILHIGTEKTGTTSLQNFLYENRDELSRQGVFLSDVIGKTTNRELAFYFQDDPRNFARIKNIPSAAQAQKYRDDFYAQFKSEVTRARATHHTMIITSEHFHQNVRSATELRRLKSALSALFDDIMVVCYFREQSELRKSVYSTALAQSETQEINDYHRDRTESDYYYNHFLSASNWAGVFGRDQVKYRIYDRDSLVGNDTKSDFLATFFPNVDTGTFSCKQSKVNQSLAYLQSKAFQAINSNIPYRDAEGRINAVNTLYKGVFKSCGALKVGKIVDRRKAAFAKKFANSNDMFFSEFVPSHGGFTAPTPDEAQDVTYSLNEVGALVQEVVEHVVQRMTNRIVVPDDAAVLADVAQKYQSQEPVTAEEAFALLRLARRAT